MTLLADGPVIISLVNFELEFVKRDLEIVGTFGRRIEVVTAYRSKPNHSGLLILPLS